MILKRGKYIGYNWKKPVVLLMFLIGTFQSIYSQCSTSIQTFPYREDFETSNGNWTSGGTSSDWSWGTPVKTVINTAGSGTKCWVTGGLTGSRYNDGEASWLQSPCFDLSTLQYPSISFKVVWETEQQFDGGSIQYSINNGGSWVTIGAANEPVNCLNSNWFNNGSINYLAPLTSNKGGWSGNVQTSTGSCRGGNGSNGWVTARHVVPAIAGEPSVIFRFLFGAGTICNNYDGFGIDDFSIQNAPPNNALFDWQCINDKKVKFTNNSDQCPTTFAWNFDDPGSGPGNTSQAEDPEHIFSGPGTYNVSLTVSSVGNAPSTITRQVTILNATATLINPADCRLNNDGSASVTVTGGNGIYNYIWNSTPAQTGPIATALSTGTYSVSVTTANGCPVNDDILIPVTNNCGNIYFPSAVTPNNDGKNDFFGPLGSTSQLSNYHLSIYNRWGERIYHTTDPSKKWDGQFKGLKTDTNVFVWESGFSFMGQPQEQRKGVVVIIR